VIAQAQAEEAVALLTAAAARRGSPGSGRFAADPVAAAAYAVRALITAGWWKSGRPRSGRGADRRRPHRGRRRPGAADAVAEDIATAEAADEVAASRWRTPSSPLPPPTR